VLWRYEYQVLGQEAGHILINHRQISRWPIRASPRRERERSCCGPPSIPRKRMSSSAGHNVYAAANFVQRGETDFFSGEPLRALSTLVFSDNVDLQRSASLTFAEITERGTYMA
jgi:hypothetical protein